MMVISMAGNKMRYGKRVEGKQKMDSKNVICTFIVMTTNLWIFEWRLISWNRAEYGSAIRILILSTLIEKKQIEDKNICFSKIVRNYFLCVLIIIWHRWKSCESSVLWSRKGHWEKKQKRWISMSKTISNKTSKSIWLKEKYNNWTIP